MIIIGVPCTLWRELNVTCNCRDDKGILEQLRADDKSLPDLVYGTVNEQRNGNRFTFSEDLTTATSGSLLATTSAPLGLAREIAHQRSPDRFSKATTS